MSLAFGQSVFSSDNTRPGNQQPGTQALPLVDRLVFWPSLWDNSSSCWGPQTFGEAAGGETMGTGHGSAGPQERRKKLFPLGKDGVWESLKWEKVTILNPLCRLRRYVTFTPSSPWSGLPFSLSLLTTPLCAAFTSYTEFFPKPKSYFLPPGLLLWLFGFQETGEK